MTGVEARRALQMIANEMMIAINNAHLYTLTQEEIVARTRAEIALKKAPAEIIHLEKEQNVVEGIEMHRKYQAFRYVDKNGDIQKLFSVIERAVKHRRTMQNLEELMPHVQKVKERR